MRCHSPLHPGTTPRSSKITKGLLFYVNTSLVHVELFDHHSFCSFFLFKCKNPSICQWPWLRHQLHLNTCVLWIMKWQLAIWTCSRFLVSEPYLARLERYWQYCILVYIQFIFCNRIVTPRYHTLLVLLSHSLCPYSPMEPANTQNLSCYRLFKLTLISLLETL